MATRGIKRRARSIPLTYHSTNEEVENTIVTLIVKTLDALDVCVL
jgi:hypothetical protein